MQSVIIQEVKTTAQALYQILSSITCSVQIVNIKLKSLWIFFLYVKVVPLHKKFTLLSVA